jgi:hypothetical protein
MVRYRIVREVKAHKAAYKGYRSTYKSGYAVAAGAKKKFYQKVLK